MKDKILPRDLNSDMTLPLVSIVTVVKNHAEGLKKTITSIQNQSYSNYEVIIVGGKSEDATEEIAREYVNLNFRIHYVREVEAGIYPAMNQGLNMTSGEYVWFLNAGDEFSLDSSLESAVNEILRTQAALIIGVYRILVGS
jgi:glycosyltransferase involved in cell wall biosynthesis